MRESDVRRCACTGYAWPNSARACYELRSYGIAGLGAPSLDEDDKETRAMNGG